MRADVAVVGSGPAGTALAAACAEAGPSVVLVAPDPEQAWPATYGAWVDELDGRLAEDAWRLRFARPLVAFDELGELALPRPYGILDNAAVQRGLLGRLLAGGGRTLPGRVTGLRHGSDGSVLDLPGGETLVARVVVDATGHRPALARAPGIGKGPGPGWQVAYGITGRISQTLVPEGGMRFMDWRALPGQSCGEPPTFLYAMDLGGGRTFLEETSLAARPALPVAALRERLERRLAAAGAQVHERQAEERVVFPMGGALPPRPQRVIAYGAAAGMVHPASGYQVATSLHRSTEVAAALSAALASGAGPDEIAARGWAAVWPDDRVRQRDLHAYGLEILLGLDAGGVQRFFAAFFSLPEWRWRGYLSGAASSRELAGTMLAVARRLPPRLRWRVSRGAVGSGGAALLRAALARPR